MTDLHFYVANMSPPKLIHLFYPRNGPSQHCSTLTIILKEKSKKVFEEGFSDGLSLGPGRLCQHNFKHNRLSILVRIMLE